MLKSKIYLILENIIVFQKKSRKPKLVDFRHKLNNFQIYYLTINFISLNSLLFDLIKYNPLFNL